MHSSSSCSPHFSTTRVYEFKVSLLPHFDIFAVNVFCSSRERQYLGFKYHASLIAKVNLWRCENITSDFLLSWMPCSLQCSASFLCHHFISLSEACDWLSFSVSVLCCLFLSCIKVRVSVFVFWLQTLPSSLHSFQSRRNQVSRSGQRKYYSQCFSFSLLPRSYTFLMNVMLLSRLDYWIHWLWFFSFLQNDFFILRFPFLSLL